MTDYWIERDRTSAGYPIMVPVVDLVEIGNGGGSDRLGRRLRQAACRPAIRRRRARARPPTAAAAREATTTDANLALGRINPDYFCGGEIDGRHGRGRPRARRRSREKLGVDADEAARGIVRIANNNMINALKLVSRQPRLRPARLHAGRVRRRRRHARRRAGSRARHPEGRRPARGASVFSAWGMLMSRSAPRLFRDPAHRPLARTHAPALGRAARRGRGARRSTQFAARGRRSRRRFASSATASSATRTRSTASRCCSPDGDDRRREPIERDRRAFHETYEREYTYRLDAPVEFVGIHLVASAEVGKLDTRRSCRRPGAGSTTRAEGPARRRLRHSRASTTPTSTTATSSSRACSFNGPAIVETPGTHHRRPSRQRRRRSTTTATSTSTSDGVDGMTAMTTTRSDPITLEIIQNSLQAISDEMFAAMRKTAMSAIIYEVLDMGTGITDARGRPRVVAAPGIPAFVGVLDKAVKRIIELNAEPGEIEPGRRLRHQRPVLRRRHPSERHRPRHAGVRRRRARRLDREHRALERRRRHGAGLDLDRGAREIFQEGLRLPAIKLIDQGEPIDSVMRHHEGQLAPARLPPGRHVGGHRRGPHRRAAAPGARRRNTASRPSWRRMAHFMDYGEQVVAARRSRELPKGRFTLEEEQDGGARLHGRRSRSPTTRSSSTCATTPTRTPGPNNACRDGVDGRGADGVQVAHRPVRRRPTAARFRPLTAPHPAGLGLRRRSRPRRSASTTRSRSGFTT